MLLSRAIDYAYIKYYNSITQAYTSYYVERTQYKHQRQNHTEPPATKELFAAALILLLKQSYKSKHINTIT